jgi:Domain of unknown function (DUF4349)
MKRISRKAGTRIVALGVVIIAGICGLGACTGSGGGSSENGGPAAGAAAAPATAAASAAARHAAAGKSGGQFAVDVTSTAKIRIADLTVAVKRGGSVPATADRAESIAITAGGAVDADDRASGPHATATLVLRVPPQQLADVLNRLSSLGIEKSRHSTTQDVTAKVADVASRVASANESILRLRQLYRSATKVRDVIAIESELAVRESNLESLQAQQRALAAQTTTARITLTLIKQPRQPAPPPPAQHRSGFIGGLLNGWDAFRDGAGALATAAGAVLPFLALLVVLFVGWRVLWPRLRQTHRPDASAEPQ